MVAKYEKGKSFKIKHDIYENDMLFANKGDKVVIVTPPCDGVALCIRVRRLSSNTEFCVAPSELEEL